MITIEEEYQTELSGPSDNAQVIYLVKHFCAQIGFNDIEQSLIASAASELSTNIIRYAEKGRIVLRSLQEQEKAGIEIIAEDAGPGISDVDEAFTEHFSTGESLGLGLPSVKRIMDELEIQSEAGKGTCIKVRKWR